MDTTKLLRYKNWWIAAGVILVLLAAVLLNAQSLWYQVQDLTFYWTERTETEIKVKEFAEEHDLFFAQYPKSLIGLLEMNPETEDFVLQYPLQEAGELRLPEHASLREVPLFLQWDSQWGYETYGSDFLAITGCGPTCLAMAGYYLTGQETMNPKDVAAFAQDNGYYAKGYGSSWTLISQGGPELGLTVKELPLVKGKMVAALEEGDPIILAMGAGDFTTTGHYIVLTGMEDGLFRVNDPNSILRSQQLWSYEQIESQIRNIWRISR